MRRVIKDDVPPFWRDYCERNKGIHYDHASPEIKRELRHHLLEIQRGLCAYCCSRIEESKAHNEHIRPRASFPKLSMDYANLIVSCTARGEDATCGMCKDRDYDERLFVSPLSEDCEKHFRFELNGKIAGITEEGIYTVNLLNLNAYKLVSRRRAMIDAMEDSRVCGKEYIKQYFIDEQEDGLLPSFSDMTEYFFNNGYFD